MYLFSVCGRRQWQRERLGSRCALWIDLRMVTPSGLRWNSVSKMELFFR
jgi:hypothetical protein